MSKRSTQKIFTEKANIIHKNAYGYSNVDYINNKTKVIIWCSQHGNFEQRPDDHLSGKGCLACGELKKSLHFMATKEEFVDKANILHDWVYEYFNVKYRGNKVKVLITCKIHGDFNQRPNDHLNGNGCPDCSTSGFDNNKKAILYYVKIKSCDLYKIGITNLTLKKRFGADLRMLEILSETYFDIGKDAYNEEQRIINENKHLRYNGAPILRSGNTEIFYGDILKGKNK